MTLCRPSGAEGLQRPGAAVFHGGYHQGEHLRLQRGGQPHLGEENEVLQKIIHKQGGSNYVLLQLW